MTSVLSVSSALQHLISAKCDTDQYGNRGEASPERNEVQESCDEDCREKKSRRMSQGGEVGGSKQARAFR